jgi:hypothetical protein
MPILAGRQRNLFRPASPKGSLSFMTIANELSSEVAAALLAAHKPEEAPSDRGNIRDVIVAIHSTLRNLKIEARRAENPPPQASTRAQSGESPAGNH